MSSNNSILPIGKKLPLFYRMNSYPHSLIGITLFIFLSLFTLSQADAAGITIGAGSVIRTNNSSIIRNVGDWTNSGTYTKSTGTIVLNGTISATVIAGSDSFNNLTINKTAGADADDNVTISTNDLTVTGTTTITDGQLIQGTTNFSLAGITVAAAGSYTNSSTGNLTLSAGVSNAGTISFDSSGGGSGDADSITIASSVASTARDWAGAGTFTMVDVHVTDQTANSGTPVFIFVQSGTDNGGNNNWIFDGGSLTSVNVEPASLIAGAESDVTVTFVLEKILPKDGIVVIDFGSGFDGTGLTTVTNSAGVDGTWAIALSNGDGTNDVVTLTRQNDGTQIAGGTTITIILEDEIKNPVISGSTGTYAVSTQTSGALTIDSGTASADTIVVGIFSGLSVTPDALGVGVITTYTIGFTTANPIPADGKIKLTFPEGYDLSEVVAASSATDIDGTLTTSVSGQILTVTRGGAGTQIGSSATIDDLVITSIRNPKSPGQTESITITTTNSADTEIDSAKADGPVFESSITTFNISIEAEPTHVRIGEMVTFKAVIENTSSDIIKDFSFHHELPGGMVMIDGAAASDTGSFTSISQQQWIQFYEFSQMTAGEVRTLTYQAVVGSGAQSGQHMSRGYIQINPIISNTVELMMTINPDPVFEVGTLIGKVFWDRNENAVQDPGEPGIPNAMIATEQGYVITTDSYGRYSIKDFISGRHMLKVNPQSLPQNTKFTTPQSVIVNQTDAMMTKVNFGVQIPEEDADKYGINDEVNRPASVIIRTNEKPAEKSLELIFRAFQKDDDGLLSEVSGREFNTDLEYGLRLPLFIRTNYRNYIEQWKMRILHSAEKDFYSDKISAEEVASFTGKRLPDVDHGFNLSDLIRQDPDLKRRYFVELQVQKDGHKDVLTSELVLMRSQNKVYAMLVHLGYESDIPVNGSVVRLSGSTGFFRKAVFNKQTELSDRNGNFEFEQILPEGEHDIIIDVHVSDDEAPFRIKRFVRIGGSEIFFVGFTEYEFGQLNIRGNLLGLTDEEKSQMTDKIYDEGRIAFYLKGKILGKYLIEASVDSDREKTELFRDLDPEDFYAVYGDESEVTASADDTQDAYYLMIQSDQLLVRYGNFNTGFSGTKLADFNRTLHGGKIVFDSEEKSADGRPEFEVAGFMAKARQRAAHDEFKSTGGSVYYLKNRQVVRGSEKLKVHQRDKINGTIVSEKILETNKDYTIDYFDGRIRLISPLSAFSFGSETITSTEILDGDRYYLICDYEYESENFQEDVTTGFRTSKTLFDDKIRIGTSLVREERPLERYELSAVHARVDLPFNTIAVAEVAESRLQASNQNISSDGGLNFSEIIPAEAEAGGTALAAEINSTPVEGMNINAQYQRVDTDFSSSGSVSQTGTEKIALDIRQQIGVWGEVFLKYDREEWLDNQNDATQENSDPFESTLLAQYRIDQNLWSAVAEYRSTNQTEQDEELAAFEFRLYPDDRTEVTLGSQFSMQEERNDQMFIEGRRKISESLDLLIQHRFRSKGAGTQIGIANDGIEYWTKRGESISRFVSDTADSTKIGIEKEITAGTKIGAFQETGGKKSFKLSRSEENGSVVEWVREESEDHSADIVNETRISTEGTEQYSQNTLKKNKFTKDVTEINTKGIRYRFLKDKGSVYLENEFSGQTESLRNTNRTGGFLRPDENTLIEFNYERYQDQTESADSDVHAGNFRFKALKPGLFTVENEWSLKIEDDAEDVLQLLSAGLIEYKVNPDWTALSRYEWSWTKSKSQFVDRARFSEVQAGLAYRPIHHDQFNWLIEYKYLSDEPTTGQVSSFTNSTGNQRHIFQTEFMWQINPWLTFVEKLALREQELRLLNQNEVRSVTLLSAHRINIRLTDRLGLGAEYRLLSSSLSDDMQQGMLIEGTARLVEGISLAVGYDFTDFNSDLADALDVSKERVFMRIFYDPWDHTQKILDAATPDPVQ